MSHTFFLIFGKRKEDFLTLLAVILDVVAFVSFCETIRTALLLFKGVIGSGQGTISLSTGGERGEIRLTKSPVTFHTQHCNTAKNP